MQKYARLLILVSLVVLFLDYLEAASPWCIPKSKELVYDFHIRYNFTSPDGGPAHLMITINGEFPAPMINVALGDCVQVNIFNELYNEGVNIHYHGLPMNDTPYDDGTTFVTECPIQPGSVKTHLFNASVPGTHFYHSHAADQQADGVYGAFIVENKSDDSDPAGLICFPTGSDYCVDIETYKEEVIILSDWWGNDSRNHDAGLANQPFVWISDPQSILINGKHSPEREDSQHFNFITGFTYRIRLICATNLSFLRWGIEAHRLTLIAVDGYDVKPIDTDYIDCAGGQRYDVLVVADQGDKLSDTAFWMYAHVRYRKKMVKTSARIVYDNSPNSTVPATDFSELLSARTYNKLHKIHAKENIAFDSKIQGYIPVPKGNPNKKFVFVVSQQNMTRNGNMTYTPYDSVTRTYKEYDGFLSGYTRWALNDSSYESDGTPLILMSHLGLLKDENFFTPNPLILELNRNDYVEIVLQNGLTKNNISEQHPFHLHGHSFWVVGAGVGDYDPVTSLKTFNLKMPMFRDTVSLYPESWTAIRFIADNPGTWMFHCHIGSHSGVMGMAAVFLEDAENIPSPPSGTTICGILNWNIENLSKNVVISSNKVVPKVTPEPITPEFIPYGPLTSR